MSAFGVSGRSVGDGLLRACLQQAAPSYTFRNLLRVVDFRFVVNCVDERIFSSQTRCPAGHFGARFFVVRGQMFRPRSRQWSSGWVCWWQDCRLWRLGQVDFVSSRAAVPNDVGIAADGFLHGCGAIAATATPAPVSSAAIASAARLNPAFNASATCFAVLPAAINTEVTTSAASPMA